jgi:hypothetical protein
MVNGADDAVDPVESRMVRPMDVPSEPNSMIHPFRITEILTGSDVSDPCHGGTGGLSESHEGLSTGLVTWKDAEKIMMRIYAERDY